LTGRLDQAIGTGRALRAESSSKDTSATGVRGPSYRGVLPWRILLYENIYPRAHRQPMGTKSSAVAEKPRDALVLVGNVLMLILHDGW